MQYILANGIPIPDSESKTFPFINWECPMDIENKNSIRINFEILPYKEYNNRSKLKLL